MLLTGGSAHHVATMLQDLQTAAAARGLKIHTEKTKVLTNAHHLRKRNIPTHISLGGETVEVLGYQQAAMVSMSAVSSRSTSAVTRNLRSGSLQHGLIYRVTSRS